MKQSLFINRYIFHRSWIWLVCKKFKCQSIKTKYHSHVCTINWLTCHSASMILFKIEFLLGAKTYQKYTYQINFQMIGKTTIKFRAFLNHFLNLFYMRFDVSFVISRFTKFTIMEREMIHHFLLGCLKVIMRRGHPRFSPYGTRWDMHSQPWPKIS